MERQPTMEELTPLDFITLDNGLGPIQAGPEQQERLDDITRRLHGNEFYIEVEQKIPSKCIDGRVGAQDYAPNSAGGTETLMVADDLTVKQYAAPTTLESYANIINALQKAGQPIGGHTDEHAHDAASGCGANDKLPAIYKFIADNGDLLRELAAGLGVRIDDQAHRLITANAAARTEFSPGGELLTVLRTAGGDDVVDPLQGDHKEVVAVINTVPGTTLDRYKLEAEFGSNYEAFNVDAWAFPEGAAAIAKEDEQIPQLVAAETYYNLATAHVLCGPNMRVIVRK